MNKVAQINYEDAKSLYKDINDKFVNLNKLSNKERSALLDSISKLNSTLKNNPEIGKTLEKEMQIVLYDTEGKYTGNRLKIMAYWLQRAEMNSEIIKLRDDNISVIQLLNEPNKRKRLKKTNEAIENMRIVEIEENASNTKLREFYLNITKIYEESISVAKVRGIKYGGMLAGLQDAEKFNDFIVGQIDLSLACLISKDLAKKVYPIMSKIFKNERKYDPKILEELNKLKNQVQMLITEVETNLDKEQKLKQKGIQFWKDIASGKKEAPLEQVTKIAEEWKKAVPASNQKIEQMKKELSGLYLAVSAIDRLINAA
jgi:hypothetical protein